MRKQFTLEQMLPILESALQYLNQFSGADLIIGLGNTGCDLSALINSLMIGPQTPPDVETDIQSDEQRGESLLPLFKLCTEMTTRMGDMYFVNLNGHQDEDEEEGNGNFVEFINLFINRYMLLKSKQARFFVPLTLEQLQNNKGEEVKKQMQVLLRLFAGNLSQVLESVIPILTKCRETDSDIDLEAIKEQFRNVFEDEISMIKDTNERDNLSAIYNAFSEKLVVYDICCNETRDSLLAKLLELTPMKGGDVQVPLSQDRLNDFNKLFKNEYFKCEKTISEWCKKA